MILIVEPTLQRKSLALTLVKEIKKLALVGNITLKW